MNPPARATDPFGAAASEIMRARNIGVRHLARRSGVSASHLSRVLREVDGKRPSRGLVERIRRVLELPEAYFLEQRCDRIVAHVVEAPGLIDELEALLVVNDAPHRVSVLR